jgi:hypothetical protein
MLVHGLESVELLEPTVHCLMPGSSALLGFLVNLRNIVIGSLNCSSFTLVAIVSLDVLSRRKRRLQSASKDLDVGPLATGERAMDPNNISCLNTHSNLISQSSSPELVGEPLLAERHRLLDPKVGAINCHLARLALITPELIAPANLKGIDGENSNYIAALVLKFLPIKAPSWQSVAEGATPTFKMNFGLSWQAQKVPSQFRRPSATEESKAGAWAS